MSGWQNNITQDAPLYMRRAAEHRARQRAQFPLRTCIAMVLATAALVFIALMTIGG